MENEKLDFVKLLSKIEGSYKGSVDELNVLIDEAFDATVKRVLSTNKKGVLTVQLSFNTVGNDRMSIEANITTKLPEPKADSKCFYHDLRGNLLEKDPNQPELFGNVKPLKRVVGGENA